MQGQRKEICLLQILFVDLLESASLLAMVRTKNLSWGPSWVLVVD